MPFDRLVTTVDRWAAARHRDDVFIQTGRTAVRPQHCRFDEFLSPAEFRARVRTASALVAHAGMGSILTALEFGKPILVMPRRAALAETRNDHQVATAERFRELGRVAVAMDEHELPKMLDQLGVLGPSARIGPTASVELLAAIRTFIGRRARLPACPETAGP